jgi:hypothetical protein
MAILTQTLEGRLLTIVNRTNGSVGVVGKTVRPGASKNFQLSKVQENEKYMDELNTAVNAGRISLMVDGIALKGAAVEELDTPLDATIPVTREVFTDLLASVDNAIKTSFTAPASDTTYSGSDLDGAEVGAGEMLPPRNVIITGTTGIGEALDGGNAVVIGEDIDGQLRSETIPLSVLGASTSAVDRGVNAFKRVVSVMIPADASGSPGDYEIGFGLKSGLKRPLEIGGLIAEFEDNAVVGTAGTVVLAATSPPNGTYSPNNAPDDAKDFIITYAPGQS